MPGSRSWRYVFPSILFTCRRCDDADIAIQGVGAWFVQVGDLNTVHHLWQFANLEERSRRREQSWAIEGWSDTVHKTVPLIQSMQSRILVPCEWSPVA